ncbi:SDR family oxidoreductase [Bradyrhizobium lablabi]|uniref:SDR family oxidoreductase n=1 Tax=Bradyrhizobium lablabi TaxID=722472 RepID=UPI001BA501C0|nr:SDR family oxidoreductase [Bradyrhizobium lablabi]MBR0696114.1 SDR family oxidoreductase [Bradyrhizobium lablabi]
MPTSKVALVTGASSGIGEATARHLAKLGHQVVLGARRLDRIDSIAREIESSGGSALAHHLDVTDLPSVNEFVAAALNRFSRVDVLVNNAGVMPLSFMAEVRLDEWNRMIDVNLRGVLHTIAVTLPVMLAQKSGHIINVASVSAYRADPTAAVYSATKFAVRALSDGLRQESKDVRVTLVSPGLTRTELFDGIASPDARAFAKEMVARASIAPSAVAEAIAFAIAQPDHVDVNELVVRPTAQS